MSFKVTVRCKDSAVLDVEQRLAEVKSFSHFVHMCLNQGGGGGDLLQWQGGRPQQGGADSDPAEQKSSGRSGEGGGVEEGQCQAEEASQLLHQHRGREGACVNI